MSDGKTHYRKVFKSDHLGAADIEDMMESGSNLVFTIAVVKQEWGVMVAGRKGNFNIAYFVEPIKPMVLNATNAKVVKKFAGGSAFVEDWVNIPVKLYIDKSVKMKGEVVGGVRINPQPPRMAKPELQKGTPAWGHAIAAYKRDGNLNAVENKMIISEQNKQLIVSEASTNE